MNIEGSPMLGTPKQNSFIIKLAGALGFTDLRAAVNTGLSRHVEAPYPSPFTMADASKVIEALLAECKIRGISTFQAKGKGKAKGKRRRKPGGPPPQPSPTPGTPPLPMPGSGALEAFERMPLEQRQAVFGAFAASLHLSGGKPLEKFSSEAMAAELLSRGEVKDELLAMASFEDLKKELGRRGAGILQSIVTPQLCGELERRGLPAGFLLTDPDGVAAADRALNLVENTYLDDAGLISKDAARTVLLDAGRLSE